MAIQQQLTFLQYSKKLTQGLFFICSVEILVFALWKGLDSVSAVIAANIVVWLPSLFYAWVVLRYYGARQAKRVMKNILLGEMLKWWLTFILFGLFFYLGILPFVLIVTYIISLFGKIGLEYFVTLHKNSEW